MRDKELEFSLTSCRALSTPGKFSNVDRYGLGPLRKGHGVRGCLVQNTGKTSCSIFVRAASFMKISNQNQAHNVREISVNQSDLRTIVCLSPFRRHLEFLR